MIIGSAFPGGNIIVDKIEDNNIYLRPDMRDTEGKWFYWYFGLKKAGHRKLVFHLPEDYIGVLGPAVSKDKGQTWRWLGRQCVKENAFAYILPRTFTEIRFSVGMPYQRSNLTEFLKQYTGNSVLEIRRHCRTKKGRIAPRLHLGCRNPRHRILITCRHHCCEMMASYVLEGIMEGILSGEEEGKWFRENVEMVVLPFMDLDGVEDGAQGKNRKPHDHNRDYSMTSIYPEVDALRNFAAPWSGQKLKIAFDLHCPYINEQAVYVVGHKKKPIREQQKIFSSILESISHLPYFSKDNMQYGKGWNVNKTFSQGKSFAQWAERLAGISLVCSIEIPYASAGNYEVNQKTAKIFGYDLLKSMRIYLES